MPMELDRRELKAQARAGLRAARPRFWLVTLLYLLLTTGLVTAADLTGAAYFALPPGEGDAIPLFLSLLLILYTHVMNFGFQCWSLGIYRRQSPGYGVLIDGFSMAGRVVVMELCIVILTSLWAFAVMFPLCLLVLSLLSPAAAFLLILLLFSPMVSLISHLVAYRYAMAPYRLMDRPELGPFVPIRESVAMMRGWKWQFFRLDLSFLGWILLNLLLSTLVQVPFVYPMAQELLQAETASWDLVLYGPALPAEAIILSTLVQVPVSLWLQPYRGVAQAGFYQGLLERPARPSSQWTGPYDGPYNGPEL